MDGESFASILKAVHNFTNFFDDAIVRCSTLSVYFSSMVKICATVF